MPDLRRVADLTVDELLRLLHPPQQTQWLRVGVAARRLGISRATLWKQATTGELPADAFRVMPNEEIRYSSAWLDQQVSRAQLRQATA